jgi:GDP-4-dehydro-6-deoxy-D-mannose reductase
LRAFVTGIEGFAGHYLAGELSAAGEEVTGSYLDGSLAGGLSAAGLFRVDLTTGEGLADALAKSGPDVVYHLAAQSSAALSFKKPELTFGVNVLGTVNLLEAVRRLTGKLRLLLVSSCEVYGPNPGEGSMDERQPFSPRSPYAASKAAQEMACTSYAHSYGIDIVIARPFPHIGPGQSDSFALPSFAKQIAEIEAGLREPVVRVGNLEARRDFTDVRDVARAYRLLGGKGRGGEAYNICSGSAVSVGEALGKMLGMAKVPIETRQDPDRLRPSDTPLLLGDNRKLVSETGWKPEHRVEESLRGLLEHWRQRIMHKG